MFFFIFPLEWPQFCGNFYFFFINLYAFLIVCLSLCLLLTLQKHNGKAMFVLHIINWRFAICPAYVRLIIYMVSSFFNTHCWNWKLVISNSHVCYSVGHITTIGWDRSFLFNCKRGFAIENRELISFKTSIVLNHGSVDLTKALLV